MTVKEKKKASSKKFSVNLNSEERMRLEQLINKGQSPAKLLLKSRILLKADASEVGEGWSDCKIVEALDTNRSMVSRVRRQLTEEGLEVVLNGKPRPTLVIQPASDTIAQPSVKK